MPVIFVLGGKLTWQNGPKIGKKKIVQQRHILVWNMWRIKKQLAQILFHIHEDSQAWLP